MSKALSKSKEKPPRSTSNETNTSFVKNVTSRMSGLLPSTITKWFSSQSSSNANGSVSTAEATDSSTEDEAPESPILSPLPVKRMRFNKPTKLNRFGASDAHCSTGNIEITEIPATSFAGMQYPSSHSNVTLTPIKINDTVTNESLKDSNEMETARFGSSQHTVSRIGQSVATNRRSIFEKTSDEKPVKVMRKAPPNPEKKLHSKPHMLGSSFYPGRTMYGGASASYISRANIRQHTVASVIETKSNEDIIMSSSARRIMDLLESYSSPLTEARRIPQYVKPNIPMNRSTHQLALNPSYKTQELHMPSLALRMRLKQKSRLMDATKTARQIIASCSSASNYPPAVTESSNEKYTDAREATNGNSPSNDSNTINASNTSQPKLPRNESEEQQSNKFTTKLKTRVTRTSHRISDKSDVATPVNLPAVSLQIDHNKLPKFTLVTPTITKSLAPSSPKIGVSVPKRAEFKPANELPASKPTPASSSSMFTFSNPVEVSCDTFDSDISFPSFTFDDPERHFEYDKQSTISSVVVSNEESNKSIPKISDWNCPDCWVKNKAEVKACVCCGYKNVNPAKCNLCKLADSQAQKDKCLNCEKMVNPPSKKSSKWRCDDCWVMNDANASKCVCCNGRNLTPEEKAARKAEMPPKVKPIPYPKNAGLFLGSSTSQAEEANSNVVSSQPSLLKSYDVGDSTLTNITKAQKSNKWECYSCLVMNESNRSLCVCCGTEKESKAKLPEVKFNFGMNTNNTFKFGIDPTVKEDKAAKKPEIKSTLDVKEKSETNNNNLAETLNYTFTLPAKKSETQIDLSEPKSVSVVKFNFGIPKDSNSLENKSQHSKTPTKEKQKAQGTPAIVIPLTVKETPKPLGECFASSQQKDKEKLSNSTSNLFTSKPLELKKDILKIPTIQPIPTSTEKPESNSTFVLGSSTLKPGTNLFSMPSASGISKDPFSSIPKTTTVTTTATTMLLMPAAQLKTEALSAVTSSVNKSVIAAPMFSFGEKAVTIPAPTTGSTLSTVVTSTDKPNFQFSFGNNNNIKADATPSLLTSSDKQSVFNSPFGTSGETPKNTNNFSFNAGGALGTSSPIGTLGGVNGLSASNALSGGDRANNMLGGNNLTGSALTGNGLPTNILTGKALSGNTFSTTNTTGGNNVKATSTLGGINGRPGSTLTGGNGMQHDNTLSSNALTNNTTNIFGSTVQKENIWNSSNNPPSTNLFVTNTTTNNLQKPPAFSFPSSTAFNSSSATPNFAGNTQPGQNIFGMANQNNNQPSLFSSSIRNPSPAPIFGSPQPANNATPQMFGASTIGTTPTFGTTNPSLPSFEVPSMPSKSAPAFNFGTPVQSSGVFGFGQQQANQQPQQAGVYSFGGAPSGTLQVQFTMGTAPNTAGRRLRKAVRRTTPR